MGQVLAFPKKAAVASSEVRKVERKPKRKVVDEFNVFGHLIIGALIGAFVAHTPLEFGLVLFGSLLPDIDHPKATLGKWNLLNRTRLFTHRGHCHSLVGAVVLSVPFIMLGGWIYPILVFGGAVGHLCGDKLASWLPGHQKFKLRLW